MDKRRRDFNFKIWGKNLQVKLFRNEILVGKIFCILGCWSGEGNGTPLQYSCLENPMDRGAWWAAVHGVTRSQTWLGDFTLTFHFHALEKEMATRSSVLAWRIPWTEEPGGLLSMGSHSRTWLKRLSRLLKMKIKNQKGIRLTDTYDLLQLWSSMIV